MADATVARLEVRADRTDPLAARLSVEHIFCAMELRPNSLPPSAILCVRELRDPRPGTVSLASRQLRPPPVWEQAMQREVDRLARAAARPAHGAVPGAAEAVVFADESELLACLGNDLVAGLVGARWWWRLLVDRVEQPRRATIGAWLRAPEHVPAALQVLAERGDAAAFVRFFDDRDARDLTHAIAGKFGLPAAGADTGTALPSRRAIALMSRVRTPIELSADFADLTHRAGASAEPHAPGAPWFAIAPEADRAGLSIEQRVLLGAALTIARAPALARSPEFAAELAAWRLSASLPRLPHVATASERVARVAPATPRVASASTRPPGHAEESGVSMIDAVSSDQISAGPPAPRTTLMTEPMAEDAMSPIASEAFPPSSAEPRSQPSPPTVFAASADTAAPATTWPPLPDEAQGAVEPARGSTTASRKQSSARPGSRAFGPPIQTGLGGVFYLVNLALYLRLYGDGREDLPLPLWDFVTLVGRGLLGDATINDPVWALLAELAGRAADEPPGAGFVPPADWRLPPAWLASFETAPAQHRISNGRLVISHAEGFVIVDVEAQGDLESQLTTELAPYRALPCAPATDAVPPALVDTPLDRWLAWLLPYLRARLRRVLAVDDAALPALLLAHSARVHVTDTHLDIVLSLETLPIEIRFAGLDRDPGWVVAAGRFIAFHFE